jgi:tetratricopeptide (TPR) repeat protein
MAGRVLKFPGRNSSVAAGRQAAEELLALPREARPRDAMEDPETLLAVSASLRDLLESKPMLLKEEAGFFFSFLDQPKRPIGLFDEREYFLGEFALLAGMASRTLAHRDEAARWLNLADANFRLTVNAVADWSRVSYHRLAMALEERRFDQVFEQLPLLRESFDRLDMAQESLKCRFLEGVALVESGAPESALKIFEEAAAEATKQGNQKLLAAAYGNLVNVHGVMGNTSEAVEASRQALRLLDKVHAREYVAKIQWGIGSLLRTQGRLSESIDAYREAGAHFEQMGMQADLAATRLMIADLYLELGQDSAALREVLFALPIVEEYRLVPEGIAALALLRESIQQQKVNHQALRDLHGFFENPVS